MKRTDALRFHFVARNISAVLLLAAAFALGSCQSAYHAKLKAEADTFAEKYFAGLKQNPNIQTLPSGVMYEILHPGAGPFPTAGDTARVHYTGTLASGVKFDSSRDRGEPADFPLSQLVPGMRDALQKINKGGKIRIHIPYDQGYGDNDMENIPPYSILVFEVELLDFGPTRRAFY